MKVKGKLIKLSLLIGFFLLISAFLIGNFSVKNLSSEEESRGILSLTKPVFAQADVTFLEEEAGISAYTDVGQEINLNRAKTGFKTIEKKTNEYIIGSVGLKDFSECFDVHVYIHKSGFMVAYYFERDPIAKIINWNNLDVTKLEEGLGEICDAAAVPFIKATYYDFRYPGAEKLMLIIDEHSFKLKIPSSLIVYERSCATPGDEVNIDENEIGMLDGAKVLSPAQLKPDVFHEIEGWDHATIGGWYGYCDEDMCGIALAYKGG